MNVPEFHERPGVSQDMKSGAFEKQDIQRFATKIGTHPAIVAGRLANRGVMKQHIGNVYGFYKKVELKG
ncbi:hypothetical protein [Chlorobium sp. KB01]|uniref:hypothetical protein n=1 Tax=Chlorobium sp. KB01 TaxID=1917528 RepID=UPI000977E7D9|nr:hypothetical protein [Chlorobium sp. KB01]